MTRVTLSRRAGRNALLSGLVLLAAACGSSGSSSGAPASAGSPSPSTAAVVRDLPSNHSPLYAPVLQPTLATGIAALTTAVRAWLPPG